MVRLVSLGLISALLAACDPSLFFVPFLPDAGDVHPDADASGAEVDAGDLDAGVFDAGETDSPDAGSDCLAPTTAVPFVCEGDEDVCDATGDMELPWSDVVAVWSHVDAPTDSLVVQIRFSALPFLFPSRPNDEELAVMFAGTSVATPGCDCFGGDWMAIIGEYQDPILEYPPRGFGVRPEVNLGDRCSSLRIGATLPLIELRVPLELAPQPAPGGLMVRVLAGPTATQEFVTLTPGATDFFPSRNGASDDEADLVPICELVCPAQ